MRTNHREQNLPRALEKSGCANAEARKPRQPEKEFI